MQAEYLSDVPLESPAMPTSRSITVPIRLLAGGLLLLIACISMAKEPATYELDPVHTRVMFAVEHAGFSKAIGTVSGSTGMLVFNPGDWSQARVEVNVPLACVDLGDAKWNRAALAGNLLNVAEHPLAHFVSTRVEAQSPERAFVHGDLTLNGVTRPVRLDVRFNALKRHPMPPFRRTAGFSATTELSRSDFGMTAWKSVIGDVVELRIEAEATRSGKAASEEEPDADSPATPADEAQPLSDPETESTS